MHDQEHVETKRQCTMSIETQSQLPSFEEDKSQSLLAWLASAEPETDYLTFLQVPPDSAQYESTDANMHIYQSTQSNGGNDQDVLANTHQSLTQRSTSHAEVRKALRAKVGITRQEKVFDESVLMENVVPEKLPIQTQNSLDRFLDSFTNVENSFKYDSEPTAAVFSDDAKTPSSLPLQSPNIPSPLLDQSLSDSELHLRNVDKTDLSVLNVDKNELFRSSNSETDLSKILDDEDLLSQLDSILGF